MTESKVYGLVNTLFRPFKLTAIANWRLERLHESDFVAALFREYGVDYAIDVGANKGQYVNFLRTYVNYDGPVLSFEPQSQCVAMLRPLAAADPHWRVEHCALGRKTGTMSLNVMHNDSMSSFLSPTHDSVQHLEKKNVVVDTEEVVVRRLDEAITDIVPDCQQKSMFLKLDTQGFDLEVVAGATDALSRIVAIQTEASVLPIYENMPSMVETIGKFKELDFTLSQSIPVSRDPKLRAVEFDLLFINNRFCA